jgi:hypothetical protein
MRQPEELSRAALMEIVDGVRQSVFLDVRQGVLTWDPGKNRQAGDILMELAGLLARHDLAPDYVTLVHSGDGTGGIHDDDAC